MDQLLAIRAFARVVEAGNFTKASDSLQLPKATVSKLVQTLETHLGVQLLQRTTRRVTVTPDGVTYYEKSARVIKELEAIDGSFSAAQSRPRGHLRMDLGSSVADRLLIPALPDFLARYPDIRIDLGVSDRHVDLIGDNIDCVIRGGALTDPGLVARTIAHARWITCASPQYIDRYGTPRRPEDLDTPAHRVVNYLSARTGRILPMRFERNGRRLEIAARHGVGINESNAHFAAGLAGLGVIQTFAFVARDAVARGELREVLPTWRPKPYPLHLVYPPNRHVSNRLRVFIDWVAEQFDARLSG